MARTTTDHVGFAPFFLVTNALIWISAVIVMGILSYEISVDNSHSYYAGSHVVYEEVIAVLTVAFFLLAFFLGAFAGYTLLFNLIFSFLWLVSVVFTASDWSYSASALLVTAEAFSFIAFFFLFFNILYDWHLGFNQGVRTTNSRV